MTTTPLHLVPAAEAAHLLDFVCWRFGLAPETFAPFRLVRLSKKTVALATESAATYALNHAGGLVGLPFLRTNRRAPKLTTAAAQRFGAAMTASTLRLTPDDLRTYLHGETVELGALPMGCTHGDVVVRVERGAAVYGVGLAFLRVPLEEEAGPIRLESRFPKAWAGISAEDR